MEINQRKLINGTEEVKEGRISTFCICFWTENHSNPFNQLQQMHDIMLHRVLVNVFC